MSRIKDPSREYSKAEIEYYEYLHDLALYASAHWKEYFKKSKVLEESLKERVIPPFLARDMAVELRKMKH